MNNDVDEVEFERNVIQEERKTYQANKYRGVQKFADIVSSVFLYIGLMALILSLFIDDITLLNATCFFIISYIVAPSDGDRYETMIKGLAEDVANIRVHITLLNKKSRH